MAVPTGAHPDGVPRRSISSHRFFVQMKGKGAEEPNGHGDVAEYMGESSSIVPVRHPILLVR